LAATLCRSEALGMEVGGGVRRNQFSPRKHRAFRVR